MKSNTILSVLSILTILTILLATGCATSANQTNTEDNDNVLDDMPQVIDANHGSEHMYP